MMTRWTKILLLLAGALSSQSVTADIIEVCNYCSEEQMVSKALSRVQEQGQYQINVLDMSNYNLSAFSITRTIDQENLYTDKTKLIEAPEQLKANIQELTFAVAKVKQVIGAPITLEQLSPFIPGPDVTSAHGVAIFDFDKSLIKLALESYFSASFGSDIAALMDKLGSHILQGIITPYANIKTSITIQWPDGTTYRFSLGKLLLNLSTSKLTLQVNPVLNSGTDGAVGIPETFENFNLTSTHVEPEILQRFINSAKRAEIEIVNIGTGSTTGNITSFSCNPKGTRCHITNKHRP